MACVEFTKAACEYILSWLAAKVEFWESMCIMKFMIPDVQAKFKNLLEDVLMFIFFCKG